MEKIFITGSKQCGTNFLLLLFTLLNFDTGFNKNDFKVLCYDNNTSETEMPYDEIHYILKNSSFIHQIEEIKEKCKIKYFIIPFRELFVNIDSLDNIDDAGFHDIYNQNSNFDFNNKNDKNDIFNNINTNNDLQNNQNSITEYNNIINYRNYIVNFITNLQETKIPTLYVDYEGMIKNPEYLYLKLKPILAEKNIEFNHFLKHYYKCCYYFKSNPDWYDWSMKWISSVIT